jgi:hypothetical protein
VSRHKLGLLPGCYHKAGVHFRQGKAQFVDFDQLFFSGDGLGPDRGLFGSALGQVGASVRSSVTFPQLLLPSSRLVVLTGFVAAFLNAAPLPRGEA